MVYKLIIVDDHPIVRRGLGQLIGSEPDLEVCGEASGVDEAFDLIVEQRPDVVIIDLSLASGHGLDLIERVKKFDSNIKMLVSSMHDESTYAERVLRCGASGYVNKKEAPEKMIDAIREVLRGEIYVSARVADQLLRRVRSGRAADEDPMAALTNRELEIFELIGRGLTVKQIAQKLSISQKTVEAHRDGIRGKLNLKNSYEVVRRAFQWSMEAE
jgi:DNA-binding NarL/FixJ family response regulator